MRTLITSEQVTEGHPDKICDRISDAVLDEILGSDPDARVAVETMAAKNTVFVAGEVTTDASFDADGIVRKILRETGYVSPEIGISADECAVMRQIVRQSPDIALGVDRDGAGGQGMMFGYATNETESLMPLSWRLATDLCSAMAEKRKNGEFPFLRPDGKAQVTVEYCDGKPVRIDSVVASAQHSPDVSVEEVREALRSLIPFEIDSGTKLYLNPTGRFVEGGPMADVGLTGRKIICDSYGGIARVGGGAFSGKDPTKVDRSGAYMARKIACDAVRGGFAERCEIELCYAIGVAEPVAVFADSFGTGDDEAIVRMISERYDLTPKGIIRFLDLKRPIYGKTSAYGHFGKKGLPWED